jgi:FkbM family methyltransferase
VNQMAHANRKIGFVLAASSHGPLILNRFDFHQVGNRFYGVGGQILDSSGFDRPEIELMLSLLQFRRRHFGDGVFLLDCGANIGVHCIGAAVVMTGWGSVLAIEAQERIYYALAGNIALNNCFNARAIHAAVAAADGTMRIPVPDYLREGSFGSLELRQRSENEFIGQPIDYSASATQEVRCVRLDSLPFDRLDMIKIDVEGMEEEAISGAQRLIAQHRPMMLVEFIKSDKMRLIAMFDAYGYCIFEAGQNLVLIHRDDPSAEDFRATFKNPE